MNPTHEYLFKQGLIGLLRGLADAFASLQEQLLLPATAHQSQDADLRAVRRLRQTARSFDLDPDAAELRYWSYIDSGRSISGAVEAVHLEMQRA